MMNVHNKGRDVTVSIQSKAIQQPLGYQVNVDAIFYDTDVRY